MSITLYKIKNKDGNPINIKVVKEYDPNNNDDYDDVIGQYLEALTEDKFNEFKQNKNKNKIFKVLLEDETKISERKENWKKQTLNNCKENGDPNCANALKNRQIRLPQFNMDILVVKKDDILESNVTPTAPDVTPDVTPAASPASAQGGTRRRRRNNKKSKRKSKNNRKKTNRRR